MIKTPINMTGMTTAVRWLGWLKINVWKWLGWLRWLMWLGWLGRLGWLERLGWLGRQEWLDDCYYRMLFWPEKQSCKRVWKIKIFKGFFVKI